MNMAPPPPNTTNINNGPWSWAPQQSCWKGYSMVGNETDIHIKTCDFLLYHAMAYHDILFIDI